MNEVINFGCKIDLSFMIFLLMDDTYKRIGSSVKTD